MKVLIRQYTSTVRRRIISLGSSKRGGLGPSFGLDHTLARVFLV